MRPLKRPPAEVSRDKDARQVKKPKQDPDTYYSSILEASNSKKDIYGMWRGRMIAAWGKYCSYCEIPMGTGLQVEHKDPKSQSTDPFASTAWTNMLLACPSCNRTKSDHPNQNERLTDFLWPDQDVKFSPDPTKSAFQYTRLSNCKAKLTQVDDSGQLSTADLANQDIVIVSAGSVDSAKATRTIGMLNLNAGYDAKTNTMKYRTTATDRRIKHRTKAWDYALRAIANLKAVYQEFPDDDHSDQMMRTAIERQVISTAISAGFWSVWVTVFYNEVTANRFTLPTNDTIQTLIKRLFITGISLLDIRFLGTDTARIGVAQMGDI